VTWDLFSSAEKEAGEARPPEADEAEAGVRGGVRAWSVSEVNAAVRELLEGSMPPLWISGEIANLTRARSGHIYFSIRDEEAQLRCVLWREQASRLPMDPEEGMAVRVHGRVTLYARRGEFQLVADRLEGEGEGLWKLAFERLRARLAAEGLLDPARRRPVPRWPSRVGLVTSPSGAALHDILTVLRRRAPWTEVVLSGCRVQGEGAAEEIACALDLLCEHAAVDVVIIGRGGGSVEDLWAFNEEEVARAILRCPVPVISAIGHETDVSIADLVADLRAPTPSAAAEAAVPDAAEVRGRVRGLSRRIGEAVRRRVERERRDVAALRHRIELGTRGLLQRRRSEVRSVTARLDALSPLTTLARGYAIPSADGRLLRGTADFEIGQSISLRVRDGRVGCLVQDIEPQPPT